MKTLILTIVALATVLGASAQEKFTLRGVVRDTALYGDTIYLVNAKMRKNIASTAIANDGTFIFSGTADKPQMFFVNINRQGIQFIAESGEILITHGEPSRVSGTRQNDIFQEIYDSVLAPFQTPQIALAQAGQPQTQGFRDSLLRATNISCDKMFSKYRNDYAGGLLLQLWAQITRMSDATLDSLCALAGPAVRDNETMQNELTRRREQAATGVGKMYVDFTGVDTLGRSVKLSEYVGRGKWILLDFWASWCGPCRQSIPDLAKLQGELGGDNFTVVGVNVWDNGMEQVKKAMINLGITWPTIVVEGRSPENKATQAYGVNGIPTMLLIDPSGKIVARNNFVDLDAVKQLITKTN